MCSISVFCYASESLGIVVLAPAVRTPEVSDKCSPAPVATPLAIT